MCIQQTFFTAREHDVVNNTECFSELNLKPKRPSSIIEKDKEKSCYFKVFVLFVAAQMPFNVLVLFQIKTVCEYIFIL